MILPPKPSVSKRDGQAKCPLGSENARKGHERLRPLFPLLRLKRESSESPGAVHFAIVTAGHRV